MNKNIKFGLLAFASLTAQISYSELPQQMINIRLVSESLIKCTQSPEECKKIFSEMVENQKKLEFIKKKINKTATREEHLAFFSDATKTPTPEELDQLVAFEIPFPCEIKTMKSELKMLSETTARPSTEIDVTVPHFGPIIQEHFKAIAFAILTQGLPAFGPMMTIEQAETMLKPFDTWKHLEFSEEKTQLTVTALPKPSAKE